MENQQDDIVKAIEMAKDQVNQMTDVSIDTNNRLMDEIKKLVLKYGDAVEEFGEYIAEDILDSYEKLIQQRKECVDKYIKFYSLILQDGGEFDISKPIKSLMEKQQANIDAWEQEMIPLLELRKMRKEYEIPTDEKANGVLTLFKNI